MQTVALLIRATLLSDGDRGGRPPGRDARRPLRQAPRRHGRAPRLLRARPGPLRAQEAEDALSGRRLLPPQTEGRAPGSAHLDRLRHEPRVRGLLRGLRRPALPQGEGHQALQGLPEGPPLPGGRGGHGGRRPRTGLGGGVRGVPQEDAGHRAAVRKRDQQEHEEDERRRRQRPAGRPGLLGEEEEEQRGREEVEGRQAGEGGRDRDQVRLPRAGEHQAEVRTGGAEGRDGEVQGDVVQVGVGCKETFSASSSHLCDFCLVIIVLD